MAISLFDALQITEDYTRPFSIKFVALDKARKTGGQIIELNNAIRAGASHSMKRNDTVSVKILGARRHPYIIHTHLILEVNKQEIFI